MSTRTCIQRRPGDAPRSLVRDPAALARARELARAGLGREEIAEALSCGYSTAGRLLRAAGLTRCYQPGPTPRARRKNARRECPELPALPCDPAEPTTYRPASLERMAVYSMRAALGLPLFHPGDVKAKGD